MLTKHATATQPLNTNPYTRHCRPPQPLQYRNVNMSPAKHATYQRLLALKSCFWHADDVLQELEVFEPADVQVHGFSVCLVLR